MRFNIQLKEIKRPKLGKKIKEFINNETIYMLNTPNADCYAFSYDIIGQKYLDNTICKKPDWSGGFDWLNGLVDNNATHIYNLKDQKFYIII